MCARACEKDLEKQNNQKIWQRFEIKSVNSVVRARTVYIYIYNVK